jgi:hypothetical protein
MAANTIPTQKQDSKVATLFQRAVPITPTDNTFIGPFSALWIGTAGNLVVVMRNGDGAGGTTSVTFTGVPAGTLLPIAVQGVQATLTTASNIVGLA